MWKLPEHFRVNQDCGFSEDRKHEFKDKQNIRRGDSAVSNLLDVIRETLPKVACSFFNDKRADGGGVLFYGINDTGIVKGVGPLLKTASDQIQQTVFEVLRHMHPRPRSDDYCVGVVPVLGGTPDQYVVCVVCNSMFTYVDTVMSQGIAYVRELSSSRYLVSAAELHDRHKEYRRNMLI
jgi:hypothetical protein